MTNWKIEKTINSDNTETIMITRPINDKPGGTIEIYC